MNSYRTPPQVTTIANFIRVPHLGYLIGIILNEDIIELHHLVICFLNSIFYFDTIILVSAGNLDGLL